MELKFNAEVKAARDSGKPIVALESTIIAHGMPFPQNLAMAERVESIVREEGAIPATIAVVNGELRVGLAPLELETFAREGQSISKVSTRDIPFVVAKRRHGATTVAATMRIAAMAHIPVFATGGMGGVHRGADKTFDVSNDLQELTESDVAVVTAGAKAILDLPLTLEVLETLGVPVVGYGTDEFPAFYSRNSGLKVPMRLDTPDEVSSMMQAKWKMGLRGGIVVANPIPVESEISAGAISQHIERALAAAAAQSIRGKDVTPFMLKAIVSATHGQSLKANIALVENNARLAARIALAYSQYR